MEVVFSDSSNVIEDNNNSVINSIKSEVSGSNNTLINSNESVLLGNNNTIMGGQQNQIDHHSAIIFGSNTINQNTGSAIQRMETCRLKEFTDNALTVDFLVGISLTIYL